MLDLRLGMLKKISELSVFFPAYNEEENIEKIVLDAKRVLEKIASKWEIIIVDDGSLDKTGQIADRLAKLDKKIKVVHHFPNRGYGGALKSGFKTAKHKWVAFMDSDGQFDFSEIRRLLKHYQENDLVLGYRLKRADSFLRKIFTWGWSFLARVLFGLSVRDYSCGFKLIKKEVFDKVQPLIGEEKVTQIELLVKAKRMGFRLAEVGVHHYPRIAGRQTGANLRVVFKSIQDLFRLWFVLRKYYAVPRKTY